ncbi:MAG TPA: hypothetical protein VL921_01235, partial [Candidatus Udaeobacter sp.]|nr:hypothetical protein [Candidatus Udaeobacter sp.]
MSNVNITKIESVNKKVEREDSKWAATWREYKKNRYLFFMLIPVIVWYAIFHYAPLYGILLAFKDFS